MSVRKHSIDGQDVFEAVIEGETITWDNELTYSSHLQIEKLLSAQVPVSDKPNEMLFIIMHQSMELWMKLVLHEIAQLVAEMRQDRVPQACKTLERIETVLRHMTHSWEVLATLTPHDFVTFRGFLKRASGMQSHQFRELEFRLGLKRADMLVIHEHDKAASAALKAAMAEPSVYDEVLRLIARKGHAIPANTLKRDFAEPYSPTAEVEDLWLTIYRDPDTHWELFRLGERLSALEYYFQEWRFKHMKTIARVIGQKPGTGGSAGADYLARTLDLTFFPELLSMRSRISPSAGSDDGGCPLREGR